MSRSPSVLFFGSKPGSVAALSILLKRGWDVRAVVVSTTVRHPWIQGPTLEDIATTNGIDVFTQETIPSDLAAEFVISYMYRHLVSRETLARASRSAVNFHAAPLPEYGGWAFYNLAILENAQEYGCTCHHMDEEFDTGPILQVRKFPIDASRETATSLERKTQKEMIHLFQTFCELVESGQQLPKLDQDQSRMRYINRKDFEAMKEIPADATPEMIQRYARAFWYPPYQGAFIRHGDTKIETVPDIVKEELAQVLHADDLCRLLKAVSEQT